MHTIINNGLTSYKTRDAAEAIAAGAGDDELSAAVIERKDGRFVVELRDEDGNFIGCL